MTKRFADGARRVVTSALLTAKELGHSYVGSEHLLLGMLRECPTEPSVRLIVERGVTFGSVRDHVIGIVGMGTKTLLSADDMTPVCRRIILRASFLASARASNSVNVSHMLMSMLREDCVAVHILRDFGVDIDEVFSIVDEFLCGDCSSDDEYIYDSDDSEFEPEETATPLLDENAVDLTEKARRGAVDPVIGREKEEEQLISILLRRSKNNPCLIGEAGVGKTAVVESLASRIVSGNVPDELKGKRIMSLELSLVVAGTKYRGEFEEKIKNLLSEVRSAGNVILFIDELHTIVGAGGAEGAIDASNILKPALARGEIRLIGATTLDEFRTSIERDKALERRFQPVEVKEPSESDCIKMLIGLKERYERFHRITIEPSAIESAVRMSKRYLPDRFLPDKAIDLIDEASANLRLNCDGTVLTTHSIALAVERKTGIPVSEPGGDEKHRLRTLESELKKSVIGQDTAISKLAMSVRRARSGVRNGDRPSASFLFIGPAGVGKTECAKALAHSVFCREGAFIRFDMSEFSEAHSISKLIGSPPGYVGYDNGGALTERVRRNPFSLVLFDEIEKSHPEVRALLLQILDEGFLTDSSGRKVRFDNTIVVMTANFGSGAGSIGFGAENTSTARNEAGKLFAPELVDRVDAILPFERLSDEKLREIAELRLRDFVSVLHERGVEVELAEDFVECAVATAESKSARAVSRNTLRLAEEAISELLLGDEEIPEKALIFAENGRGFAKIPQKSY